MFDYNAAEDENEINEDDFESQLTSQIETYFSSNEYIDQSSLPNFLDSIGLSEWNTPDDLNVLWNSLKNYSKDGKVNKENTKKGLFNFISDQPEEEINRVSRISRMSLYMQANNINENNNDNNNNKVNEDDIYSPNSPPLQNEENKIENIINDSDEDILRKLLCVFNILYLNNRKKIKFDEIDHTLKMYNFLGFTSDYILNFINEFCSIDNNDNSYVIIKEKYNSLHKKILDIVNKYKQNYKRYENNLYDENPSSYNNVLDDLINIEKECECYTVFLSKDRESNNKDYLFKEILFLNEQRLSKIETLRNYFDKLNYNINNLEEEYQELNQKLFERNEDKDNENEQIENLMDENNILKNEREIKNDKIDNLEKEILNKEMKIQEISNVNIELKFEIDNLNKNLNELKNQNEKLKKNYEEGITNILEKIKFENEMNEKLRKKKELNEQKLRQKSSANLKPSNSLNEENEENKEMISNIVKNINNNNNNEKDYKSLVAYSAKLDMNNQTLNNKVKELENKIKELNNKLQLNMINNDEFKNENIILKSENMKLQNKINDLQKDLETNEIFRPSNVNNLRISVGNNNQNNMKFDKDKIVVTKNKTNFPEIKEIKEEDEIDLGGSNNKTKKLFFSKESADNFNIKNSIKNKITNKKGIKVVKVGELTTENNNKFKKNKTFNIEKKNNNLFSLSKENNININEKNS